MTEEEAKTKWCPMARDSNTAGNRARYGAAHDLAEAGVDDLYVAEAAAEFPCIATACMAWRWRFVQTNKDRASGAMWPQPEPIYERTDDGYCGLAGARWGL